MLRLFKITPAEYDVILEYQGGVCAVCHRPPVTTRLHIDHRHSDGLVRGLLCHTDNRAIAMLRDDPARAYNVAAYLERPPAVAALAREVFGRTGRTTRRADKKRDK